MKRSIGVVGIIGVVAGIVIAHPAAGQEPPDDLTNREWRCERQASRSLAGHWAGVEACVAECRSAREDDPTRACGPLSFDATTEVCIQRDGARSKGAVLRRCAGDASPECWGESHEDFADRELAELHLAFGRMDSRVSCDDASSADGSNADERSCQARLAKEGTRLVRSARRCLEECHDRRQYGRVEEAACRASNLGTIVFDARAQACIDDAKRRFVASCPVCFDAPDCWNSSPPTVTCHTALAEFLASATDPAERLLCVDGPRCGDGRISGAEECDPSASAASCGPGEGCTDGCTCAPIPDVCGDVTVLPSLGGTFTGETSGLGATAASCGGESAPERVFAWTAPTSGIATIDTCGSGFDAIVSVRTSCDDASSEVSCSAVECGHGSGPDLVVEAGATYFLLVDGAAATSGVFTLSVTPPAMTGCRLRLRADLDYPAGTPDVSLASISIAYPGAASLPGSLDDASVVARVTNLHSIGGGLLGASDMDDRVPPVLTAGLASGGTQIAAGPFVDVVFDCAVPLAASDFSCGASVVSSTGGIVPASCALSVQSIDG